MGKKGWVNKKRGAVTPMETMLSYIISRSRYFAFHFKWVLSDTPGYAQSNSKCYLYLKYELGYEVAFLHVVRHL